MQKAKRSGGPLTVPAQSRRPERQVPAPTRAAPARRAAAAARRPWPRGSGRRRAARGGRAPGSTVLGGASRRRFLRGYKFLNWKLKLLKKKTSLNKENKKFFN